MSYLPGILAQVAEVADEATALQLARELGGTEIKLTDRPDSILVRTIGQAAATKLVQARGGRGESVMVPMANARGQAGRRAAVAQMMANGLSQAKAALAADVHVRTAKRVTKTLKTEDLPLFRGDRVKR